MNISFILRKEQNKPQESKGNCTVFSAMWKFSNLLCLSLNCCGKFIRKLTFIKGYV